MGYDMAILTAISKGTEMAHHWKLIPQVFLDIFPGHLFQEKTGKDAPQD